VYNVHVDSFIPPPVISSQRRHSVSGCTWESSCASVRAWSYTKSLLTRRWDFRQIYSWVQLARDPRAKIIRFWDWD